MPAGPPVEGPKGKNLPEPLEVEGATPEASRSRDRKSASTLRQVGMYAGRRVIPCLSVRLSIRRPAWKKGDTVPP